ncbi:MAG: ASKHA domain-containing protein [Anaerolineae bacterium]
MKYIVDFEPIGRRAEAEEGETILEVARRAGVGLAAICGGKGTCGRCRVRVVEGRVFPITSVEARILSQQEQDQGLRLACQTRLRGPLKLHIPARSLTAPQRTQVEGQEVPVEPAPPVEILPVQLPPPTLTDIRSDLTRLQECLSEQGRDDLAFDFALLRRLPAALRQWNWQATLTLRGREVVNVGPPGRRGLGLAVDLGTTKLAAYLVDLETGRTLSAEGAMNPQIAYGEDVMARITYAIEGEGHAETLQNAIVQGLGNLARALCEKAGRRPEEIDEAVIVGNTAMHHLFLGLPVRQLGLAPYLAAVSDPMDVKARDVGLEIAPGGYIHLLPNIAGFVGADHVAMLLATGIYKSDKIVVGMDIGTNTEVALRTKDRLITCSTASGPAFEGAHIRDGMRAAEGAIESVRISDSQIEYQTIGDVPPAGLCGSGILDAVAELCRIGVLDYKGMMHEGHPRVRATDHGLEFVLVSKEETSEGREIVITRADVGQIQLAKGAMRAGLNVLLAETGLSENDIEEFIIAGAFGSYINVESAVRIGMFPPLPLERFKQVGNAAGMGAKLALISMEQRAEAARIARLADYIELTGAPRFVEEFMYAMLLQVPGTSEVPGT